MWKLCAPWLAILTALLASPALMAADAEQAYPVMPVAEWQNGPLQLEDFKGQIVAIVFFDDGSSANGPDWGRASQMIRKELLELPFVMVPIATFGSPHNFGRFSGTLWGGKAAVALDCGDACLKQLAGGQGMVIYGPDGRELWRGSDHTKAE